MSDTPKMDYILALDIGNTRSKAALYEASGRRLLGEAYPTAGLAETLGGMLAGLPAGAALHVGYGSTALPEDISQWPLWAHSGVNTQFVPLTAQSPLPIQNAYATPHTLGVDRILGVVAACSASPGKPVMVLDAGTAITYDLADSSPCYLGGAISPGLRMRLQALHAFTARLPALNLPAELPGLIGDSTANSMYAGVVHGAIAEAQGMIERYRAQMGPELQVFLTGGDMALFEMNLKDINFANPWLVTEGIFYTLKHNRP